MIRLSIASCQKSSTYTVFEHTTQQYFLSDFGDAPQEHVQVDFHVVVQKHARFELYIALTQLRSGVITIMLDLVDASAQAEVIVLYALSDTQNIKIVTKQQHVGAQSMSRMIVHGMIKGASKISYEGMISMLPGSVQADAGQQHTTIVLDRQARVISVPSIEVLHSDVQCFHGAAIGQFQEQHMWYLHSKGFDPELVERFLVRSFFAEHVIKFVDSQNVLEHLCQKIVSIPKK